MKYFVFFCYIVKYFVTLQRQIKNYMPMDQLKKQQLFTLEEIAKLCQCSRNAIYMHYVRGHIKPAEMASHRLYFTLEEVELFRSLYKPFIYK